MPRAWRILVRSVRLQPDLMPHDTVSYHDRRTERHPNREVPGSRFKALAGLLPRARTPRSRWPLDSAQEMGRCQADDTPAPIGRASTARPVGGCATGGHGPRSRNARAPCRRDLPRERRYRPKDRQRLQSGRIDHADYRGRQLDCRADDGSHSIVSYVNRPRSF